MVKCLQAVQASMTQKHNKVINKTTQLEVGEQVWMKSKNIFKMIPSGKLDHQWIGPFSFCQKVFKSTYRVTLPLSMKGFHLVVRVSVQQRHRRNPIAGRQEPKTKHVEVNSQETQELAAIVDCKMCNNKLK